MRVFTFLLSCIIFFCTSCSKQESNDGTQTKNRILSNNSERGLYEVNVETGKSTLLVGYNYIEMYDPILIKNKNKLIIPGILNWQKYGFISIDLITMSITEFENSNSWKDFELNTKTGKIYSSNFSQGLYDVNVETGVSTLLVKYKYSEMYKPIFIPSQNKLIIPGNIRNNIHGFISIDLSTMKIAEFQNEDCWQNFELNPSTEKVYCNNSNKGLYEVDINTGKATLLVSYKYSEMYKPVFLDQSNNKLVIPGFISNYDDKRGFVIVDLKDLSKKEFFNMDCYKNFVTIEN